MARLWWIIAVLLTAFAAPAQARGDVKVHVARAGDGGWTIDYDFGPNAPVWVFRRSALALDGKPWRPQSFTVETRGVTLERIGEHDVLVGGGAPLRRVRIRMQPFAAPLIGDYTPALAFSDGGIAIFTDQFTLFPAASRAAVAKLPADLNGQPIETPETALQFTDPGRRLLIDGEAVTGEANAEIDAASTYIYSGAGAVKVTEEYAGVIDPGLPEWIGSELDAFTPAVFRFYRARMGEPVSGRPMALVAWQGAERPGRSLGGSVLDGMVVMQLSGQQVLTADPRVRDDLHWFIGHESSHFWLGQTVGYTRRAESWMLEGGADLLAIRANELLTPGYDGTARLQQSLDECLQLLGPNEPLAGSEEHGKFRAHYACGALLYRVAEAIEERHGADVFAFVRALIAARDAERLISAENWFTALGESGADAATLASVRSFVAHGSPDPRRFWRALFDAAGVAWHMQDERIMMGPAPAAAAPQNSSP